MRTTGEICAEAISLFGKEADIGRTMDGFVYVNIKPRRNKLESCECDVRFSVHGLSGFCANAWLSGSFIEFARFVDSCHVLNAWIRGSNSCACKKPDLRRLDKDGRDISDTVGIFDEGDRRVCMKCGMELL